MVLRYSKLALSSFLLTISTNLLYIDSVYGGSTTEQENDRVLSPAKIVGGTDAPINEYPWFAGTGCCGGTLVTPEFVLTAAHCNGCISQFTIGDFCRNSGDPDNNNCGQTEHSRNVVQKFMHPSYNSNTFSNDFSLMKLSSPVPSDYPIAEMDLDNISYSYSSENKVWTLGFGTQSSGGSSSTTLKHVEVSYVDPDTCQSAYSGYNVDSSMMCAADPGEDACQGDSGGPLYDKENEKLVGVVSWGIGCANPSYPGVYARVGDQADWIKETICKNHSTPLPSFCDPPEPCTGTPATLSWKTDKWAHLDNGFTITNISTDNVLKSQSVGSMSANTQYNFEFCIPNIIDDCYEFKAIDTFESDGLVDDSSLSFNLDGNPLLAITPADGIWTEKMVQFGNCNSPPTPNPPTPTPPTTNPPTHAPTGAPNPSNNDYISFQNKADNNLCMGVKGTYGGAPAITKSCSSSDNNQKFQVDDLGRIHLYTRPDLCLKKVKLNVKVGQCGTTNIFKWAYNLMDSRLVYYAAPLKGVIAIANDTPGVGKAIKLAAFNNNAQTQFWEVNV
jgi:hypothetical protein